MIRFLFACLVLVGTWSIRPGAVSASPAMLQTLRPAAPIALDPSVVAARVFDVQASAKRTFRFPKRYATPYRVGLYLPDLECPLAACVSDRTVTRINGTIYAAGGLGIVIAGTILVRKNKQDRLKMLHKLFFDRTRPGGLVLAKFP